jgi:DNA-binding transcriptional regulator YhcF (GntR family)
MLWNVDPASSQALQEQIAANVRRAIAESTLEPGERLPPAQELAVVLDVNANTVLAAYRKLRDEGLLEFRRGRGVRVRADAAPQAAVAQGVRQLLAVGREYGYTPQELAVLITTIGRGKA